VTGRCGWRAPRLPSPALALSSMPAMSSSLAGGESKRHSHNMSYEELPRPVPDGLLWSGSPFQLRRHRPAFRASPASSSIAPTTLPRFTCADIRHTPPSHVADLSLAPTLRHPRTTTTLAAPAEASQGPRPDSTALIAHSMRLLHRRPHHTPACRPPLLEFPAHILLPYIGFSRKSARNQGRMVPKRASLVRRQARAVAGDRP
jgi:hypothetical protein